MMTAKQNELLTFLMSRRGSGVCPSFQEMADHLGLKSKSGVHRLIGGLEARGFISRIPNNARSIDVIRTPTDATYDVGYRAGFLAGHGVAMRVMRAAFIQASLASHKIAVPAPEKILPAHST